MTFKAFDVVAVPFPFTDQNRNKERPAVVVSSAALQMRRADIILMPITSKITSHLNEDSFFIEQWQSANLLKPSVIKPVIQTLSQRLVLRHWGTLAETDRIGLRQYIKAHLEL